MNRLLSKLKDLLDIFLKTNCPLCVRQTAENFCQDCLRQLQRCKLENTSQLWQGELLVLGWGRYGKIVKRAIAALKYENQPQLAQPLGFWLGETWIKAPESNKILYPPSLTVVPIPIHASKLKHRGYNQADLLAESFCQYTKLPLQKLGLERIRATEAQFNLSKVEREKNLINAFCLGKGFNRNRPESVLLLDDIYTTGATARAAAQTLRQQGIEVYGLVAIAIADSTVGNR